MNAIKLYTILLFGLWSVAEGGILHCCTIGHLSRNVNGTIRCVDVGMPTYINKKRIPIKLSLSQCSIIKSTTLSFTCKEGVTCKDALYDEESNLVVGVQVQFSEFAKDEWKPFNDVPRSKVKICDPKSMDPEKIVDVDVPDKYGQTQHENDFIKLNCSYKDYKLVDNGYFIEDPFLNSPMSDHPLVLYLKKRVEPIDYCAYNRRTATGVLFSNGGSESCSSMVTCGKEQEETYKVSKRALEQIENSSEPTMLNYLLICSAKNEFPKNATILKTKTMMLASPSEFGNGDELLPLLDELGGHKQIIARIIKDNGTELSYWRRNERKLDCPKGISRLENVAIDVRNGRLSYIWRREKSTKRVCLSPTNDGGLDAYVCEGYSEPAPTTTTTEEINMTVEVSTAEVSTVRETVLTSTEKPSSANGILISAFLIPIISCVTLSIH